MRKKILMDNIYEKPRNQSGGYVSLSVNNEYKSENYIWKKQYIMICSFIQRYYIIVMYQKCFPQTSQQFILFNI